MYSEKKLLVINFIYGLIHLWFGNKPKLVKQDNSKIIRIINLVSIISEPPKLSAITAGSVLFSHIIWDDVMVFDVWDNGITYLVEGSCIQSLPVAQQLIVMSFKFLILLKVCTVVIKIVNHQLLKMLTFFENCKRAWSYSEGFRTQLKIC